MNPLDGFVALERSFWTGDADWYRAHLAEQCLMVFPGPVGRLDREQVIAAIARGPRWDDVEIHDAGTERLDERVLLLTYRAVARRRDTDDYRALATSAYLREDASWCLAYHQQTPM